LTYALSFSFQSDDQVYPLVPAQIFVPLTHFRWIRHSTNYLSRRSTFQPKIAGPNHQLARSEALPVANPMR
jgi:hypothetical protein